MLPFTHDQFLDVFARYNVAAWPTQVLAYLLAAAMIAALVGPAPTSGIVSSWVGWVFVAYAVVIYPLVGLATGSVYPGMPLFGITPCPVTIFTFGMLLLASSAVRWWLLVIPFIWSLIGGSAAVLLHVPQDWFLLFSGIVAVPIVLRGRRRQAQATA